MANPILTELTNQYDLERYMRSVPFSQMFGTDLSFHFKPFTSATESTLPVAKYERSTYSSGLIFSSGTWFVGADTSGLNPFGISTLNAGIISGSGTTDDLNQFIAPDDVRAYGLRTPQILVGWGYDIFGYPAPNYSSGWNVSGTFNNTGPTTLFPTTGIASATHGNNVPHYNYRAGPLDVRWDNNRKVWTSPQSVYAATVVNAYNNGVLITDFSSPMPRSTLTYDAEFYDGTARPIIVTGVSPVGLAPKYDAYKVYPLPINSFVFIVHQSINGSPNFGIFSSESPGTIDCSQTTNANSLLSIDPLLVPLTYTQLVENTLTTDLGGTSFSNYPSGSLLVGDLSGSGTLQQFQLTAGSGIAIEWSPTGTTMNIRIASGVAFVAAGVNNTILELQGLTTPLSLAQGGTGASAQNFIDLTTSQVASGIKTFNSSIRAASGNYTTPGLGFNNDAKTGFYCSSRNILGLSTSGVTAADFNYMHSQIYGELFIMGAYNSTGIDNNQNYAPLVINRYTNAPFNPVILAKDLDNSNLGILDRYGRWTTRTLEASGSISMTGSLLNLVSPTGFGDFTISAKNANSGVYFSVSREGTKMTLGPSGNQTILYSSSGNRQIEFASGWTGNIGYTRDTGATGAIQVRYGLIVGIN